VHRIDISKSQIAGIATMMRDAFGEDEKLYLDTLEGETDLLEIARALLAEIEEDEGIEAALACQINDRQARRGRAAHRNVVRRNALAALLDCARLDKLVLPEATLSVRRVPPKPVVTDETAVPDGLCKLTRRPDMAAIKAEVESGAAVPGVSLDNGGVSLTIRRK
jgi:hypothetical protein